MSVTSPASENQEPCQDQTKIPSVSAGTQFHLRHESRPANLEAHYRPLISPNRQFSLAYKFTANSLLPDPFYYIQFLLLFLLFCFWITMLAFINSSVCQGPEELRSPTSRKDRWKTGAEMMDSFVSSVPDVVCLKVEPDGAVAYTHRNQNPMKPRYLACVDDIICIFVGCLDNLPVLRRQYGLAMNSKEDMVVIEAYRALRDRSPYPADQVLKEFSGSFAFVLLDSSTHTIFAAADKEGRVMLHWGTAADGALVFSDDPDLLQDGCDKSFAPFPAGCMFWNGGGLQSFEHPLYKMQAVARLDSEGQMCGATFRVDKMSRVNSIPRVGSSSNWANLYSFAH